MTAPGDTMANSIDDSLPRLPQDVQIMEFARHRAEELASLTACIEGSEFGGNKRIFQQLPHYMRRRAMSHNVKRVPRRLREIHKREIEKVGRKVSKRPSRKHRRRPGNLLQAYNRRQRSFVWLETHIWHAKRFKMDARWGYKIPLHPCDKSVRACYHAATDSALLQDISYLCCIELSGQRHGLLSGLAQLTNPKCGLTFASVMHLDGTHEGCTILYHIDQYPYGAIGPVTFHWWVKEQKEHSSELMRLWIWSHPSIFQAVRQELITVFQLELIEAKDPDNRFAELAKQSKDLKKLSVKLEPFYERPPIYSGSSVTMISLKDQLVRFRLLGQLSTAVLTTTLQTIEVKPSDVRFSNFDQIVATQQTTFWTEMTKYPVTSRVPPHSIVAMKVRDPRESLPVERNRVVPKIPESDPSYGPLTVNSQISYSHLWDPEAREAATLSKISDAEMNHLRSQLLVPGTPLNLGNSGSQIPVLLIQQCAGSDAFGTNAVARSGWDLVLPAGWGMAFWIPLVYRGARVGGMREMVSLTHECGGLHFPMDFPDTEAGTEIEEQNHRELKEKFFKYPPNKRPNFVKLGIAAPFSFPWNRLVSEWSAELAIPASNRSYFVLRERSLLRGLQRLPCFEDPSRRRRQAMQESADPWDCFSLPVYGNAVVAIRLTMVGHGALTQFALVCAPNSADLDELAHNHRYVGPCEPHHPDSRRELRHQIAAERRILKKGSLLDQEMVAVLKQDGADDFEQFFTAPAERLIHSSSRPILGWVKSGGFTFVEGRVTGLAFVSWYALISLLKVTVRPLVLVRSQHSFQYHFAEFRIQMVQL